MRGLPVLDLTAPGVRVGNHSVWIPDHDGPGHGVKFPYQRGGRIQKHSRPNEPTYPLDSLAHEVAIMRALASRSMAPPVGDWVYYQEVVGRRSDLWWCDPCGAYGYEMRDATRLPPGRFDHEAMQALPIRGSTGAWNDILVPDRQNVVNGYLVDVRRSAFDMLRWEGRLEPMPGWREDVCALLADVQRDGQFPPGERPEPYQDYFLDGTWHPGARRVHERAALLGFAPRPCESVLDIGCQTGGFLQLAWQRTGGTGGALAGIDVHEPFVDIAKRLARHAGMDICYRTMDATDVEAVVAWTRCLPGGRPDHLFLLAMDKHLGEPVLWSLVDRIGARRTYLETNAQREGVYALRAEVERRGGRYLGDSTDRNVRRLYVIERTSGASDAAKLSRSGSNPSG